MAEAVAAAATLISIVGFSAQVFDGCVKGFVLLSTAQNLGKDAEILRSMLEWEQFRLEQWGEKAGLQDPATADILIDWKLIESTLIHLKDLITDTEALRIKYDLDLVDQTAILEKKPTNGKDEEKLAASRFKRLFGQDRSSTAVARVIQSRNSAPKKLWWAAVDKQNFQKLIDDIAHFVQRLHDLLSLSMQAQMQKQLEMILQNGANSTQDVPDLEFLREIAAQIRQDPPVYQESHADEIAEDIEKRFRNLLFHHIKEGEVEEVESLLDKGIDVDAKNHIGYTTMMVAAESGQLQIFKLLLKRGASHLKANIGNRRPLGFAAEEGHESIVRLLLEQPSTELNWKEYQDRTALFKAANSGHHAIVELLLQQPGIDPDATDDSHFTPLLGAIYGGHTKVVKLLLDRPEVNPNHKETSFDQTPLWMAATEDDEILHNLLSRPEILVNKTSKRGETPFYHSIEYSKKTAAAKTLLAAGADPNLPNNKGSTPLSLAAEEAKDNQVSLLLAQPTININLQNHLGLSPLHRAVVPGNTKILRLLLAHSPQPDIELKTNEGKTAFSAAALNGHKVCAKILLKAGANINTQDSKGNTPLALASANGHDAVVRFLLENKADPEVADEDEETPLEKARDAHMDQIVKVFQEVLNVRRDAASGPGPLKLDWRTIDPGYPEPFIERK